MTVDVRMSPELSPRHIEVLHAVVQAYTESGEPVPSRDIARRRKDGLSAATIRNIMADLDDMGYLAQPHTSAGRIPTEKAFRHFAETLVAGRLAHLDVTQLRDELVTHDTLEERLDHGSHVLTSLSRQVGIVAAIPASSQTLDQIELVQLPDRRVLMVVVTRDRMVHNQVVRLDEPVTQDELYGIRNYVNHQFSGWVLTEIRFELARRLATESAAYDRLMLRLQMLYQRGLLEVELAPRLSVEGASNLVGLDLHLTNERLRELFRALEEKKRLLQLLDQFLESSPGQLQVQVGLADAHPSMRSLALIGIHVQMPGGLTAKMAVLGPMSMSYPRAIHAILQLGHAFQQLPQ
jgi:heat-inducible transcriptional repressor